MSKELGKVLQFLRKRNELTQRQVATELHIDRSTYAYYESGRTEPDLKGINKLAKMFNVDPSYILPDSDGKINISLADVSEDMEDVVQQEPFYKEPEMFDPKDEKIYSLSKEERGFLIWFRTLSDRQKELLKDFVSEEDSESASED